MFVPGTIGWRGGVKEAPPSPGDATYVPLSFTGLSTDYSRPQAGTEIWYTAWQCSVPNVSQYDVYTRLNWAGLNPTEGGYNWTVFDQYINSAIDNGRGFSFGIMTQYPGGAGSVGIATYGGAASAYPQWLHNQMQTETIKDYIDPTFGGDWVPNWNSTYYLGALQTFYNALASHISSTSHSGVSYADVINYVDIRGWGAFGEWHTYPFGDGHPTDVTSSSLSQIIDIHKAAFPDFQLQCMVDGMDGGGWSNVPHSISYKLLTDSNNVGEFGIRRDSWGATQSYYNQDLWQNNPGSYNGQSFGPLMMNKYKYAPITGEPCCAGGYGSLPTQVSTYHVSSFGNGNYGSVTCSNVITASRNAGYRIRLTGGEAPNHIPPSGLFHISISYQNLGIAPVYKNWTVQFELRTSGGSVVWTGTSSKQLRLFLPNGTPENTTDSTFNLGGSVADGTYNLFMIVRDPLGYRQPFPLDITGRTAGGAYQLVSGVTVYST